VAYVVFGAHVPLSAAAAKFEKPRTEKNNTKPKNKDKNFLAEFLLFTFIINHLSII
jgi:hypothetical protein